MSLAQRILDAAEAPESAWDEESSPWKTSDRAWLALGVAALPERGNTYVHASELRRRQYAEPPRWPSTLNYIDTHCGGFYGVSSLGAEKGCGKTLLGTASAIEAAATGRWQVCVFSAEEGMGSLAGRLNRYVAAHPHTERGLDHLHYLSVGKGTDHRNMVFDVGEVIDHELSLPVLVVIDSINTVAQLSGRPYLQVLGEIGTWAMFARRLSRGAVSFMIVSETNQRGVLKGANIEYWSDVILKLKRDGDSKAGIVEMRLDKSRSTAGEGPMGKYLRVWHRGVFLREDEAYGGQDRLRVVGDDVDF